MTHRSDRAQSLDGHRSPEKDTVGSTLCDVVGIVSHDLRAPLTVIKGYLELLERPLPDADRREAITNARTAANRMKSLLDDLLQATSTEDLLSPRTLERVSLRMVAEEAVSGLSALGVHPELIASCEGTVLGEERRLHQVLMNLLSNAHQHVGEGGTVNVRVDCEGDRVLCRVEDNGPGIPKKERARVFDRFTRMAESEDRPGLGLGLYIVKTIVEAHGGEVRIESARSLSGACFVVDLPAAPDSESV